MLHKPRGSLMTAEQKVPRKKVPTYHTFFFRLLICRLRPGICVFQFFDVAEVAIINKMI